MDQIMIKDLCKSYGGVPVLQHLSHAFPIGRASCVMGPSGCGKTTLLRLMAGLEKPDSGQLLNIPGRLSMVFQEDRLCEDFSVERNLRLTAVPGLSRDALSSCLEDLVLPDSLSLPVRSLSGGMKRRVALARALLAPYELLLLDEPFKGLDEATKSQVLSVLPTYTAGKTVILITHDPAEADALAAPVLCLG